MNFKIDENLPIEITNALISSGHDAITVVAQKLGGKSDSTVSSVCQQEHRILVTIDTDFADIRVYPPKEYPGIIVLRLRQQDKNYVLAVIKQLLPMFEIEPIEHHLWIVEENRLRIRD